MFQKLALSCLGLVFLSDAIYSLVLIHLFVQPIRQTVGKVKGVTNKSATNLKRITKNALVGGALTVVSSSIFYLMVGASLIWIERFYTKSIWLNWQITGIPLDSICNDIGVLISSGTATWTADFIRQRVSHRTEQSQDTNASGADWMQEAKCEDDRDNQPDITKLVPSQNPSKVVPLAVAADQLAHENSQRKPQSPPRCSYGGWKTTPIDDPRIDGLANS
jgi:hypothetical protein